MTIFTPHDLHLGQICDAISTHFYSEHSNLCAMELMQGGCNFGAQRRKLQDTLAINRDFLELLFPRPLCWIMFDAVKVKTPKFRLYVTHLGMYSYKDLERESLFISFYL